MNGPPANPAGGPFLYPTVRAGGCPPSRQPTDGHCCGRQSGHFLETGSLPLPLAALRRFPRRPVIMSSVGAGFYPARGRGRALPLRTPHGTDHTGRTESSAPTSRSVGADAYIGPNRIFPASTAGHAGPALQKPCRAAPMCATDHRTSCNMSLRKQRARWLWQSASPVPKGPLA